MGTNYYYVAEDKELLHIGKSSYGWEFMFRAQPDFSIFTRRQWLEFLSNAVHLRVGGDSGNVVVDEYGGPISLGEFELITLTSYRQNLYDKTKKRNHEKITNHTDYVREYNGTDHYTYKDIDGYSFSLNDFS